MDQFLQETRLPVRYASQIIDDKKLNVEKRFQKAQEQLKAIAGAQLIITSRIHTALPAVALETPVLFLTDGFGTPQPKQSIRWVESVFLLH